MKTIAGRIQKTFGANGELLIVPNVDVQWENQRPFFVNINELWTPFFIISVKEQGSKKIVVFENMESQHLAQTLVGKELYIESKKEVPISKDAQHTEYQGYTVFNEGQAIGVISQLFDFNGNRCFEIMDTNGKASLIPAHPDFIVKICEKERHLYLSLPEGVLNS